MRQFLFSTMALLTFSVALTACSGSSSSGNNSDIPTAFNSNNLTSFNDVARNGTTNNALKVDNAVQITHNYDNQSITANKITGAVVEFDYDADGDFDANGLNFYFADKKYSVTDGTASRLAVYDDSPDSGTADIPDHFSLYRYGSDFGFIPNYMAGIFWRVTEDDYETIGYAITGFETDGSSIPTNADFTFTGKGGGRYYSVAIAYYFHFDVSANVDVSEQSVVVTATNTCRSWKDYVCADVSYQASDLDWTGTLNYTAGDNAITGNIATIGGDSYAKLSGTADARFYGMGDNAATELGGTFSMSNDDARYVGWFGVTQPYTISSATPLATTITTPTEFNSNSLTGFNDTARNSTNNALKIDNSVQVTRNTYNRTITSHEITGAVVEFDYDADGDFTGDGVTLYFADKKYSATNTESDLNYIYDDSPDSGDADTPQHFALYSNNGSFDFTPNYLALVFWRVTENDYQTIGYAMTGFETDGSSIPADADFTFTGKGQGQYYSVAIAYYLNFDVTANVDVSQKNVVLTATNTCRSGSVSNCAQASYQAADLDWTGTLNYTAGENAITGNIATTGGDSYAQLTGTADARFYGRGDNVATELGGTFIMQNDDARYVGYFGATKPYTISSATPLATTITTPTEFNSNSLTGFNDANRNGKINNALKIDNAVQITRNYTDKAITSNEITGAVVEFSYDANGDFTDDGVSFYFADKKYSATDADEVYSNHITDKSPDAGSDDIPASFGLYSHMPSLDFTTHYMALVFWHVNESDYSTKGVAVAGFETDGGDIPTSETATFKGRGFAQYYSTTIYDYFYFDVTAEVNFSTPEVTLESTNTCISMKADDCAQAHYQTPDLDWMGTLNYTAGDNAITGNIATTGGDSYAELTGTADARFYGTGDNAAIELGGTFSMSNDDASYVGYFGAKK